MPTNELNTTTYVEEVKRVVDSLPGVSLKLIEGAELERQGFGGIWGVGKVGVGNWGCGQFISFFRRRNICPRLPYSATCLLVLNPHPIHRLFSVL